jgi:hypothetical protein
LRLSWAVTINQDQKLSEKTLLTVQWAHRLLPLLHALCFDQNTNFYMWGWG